jgi:hypothetical protein
MGASARTSISIQVQDGARSSSGRKFSFVTFIFINIEVHQFFMLTISASSDQINGKNTPPPNYKITPQKPAQMHNRPSPQTPIIPVATDDPLTSLPVSPPPNCPNSL